MKTTLTVITASIVPFGFVVLAISFLSYTLAKRRQQRLARLQTSSASTQGDRAGHPSPLLLGPSLGLEAAAAQTIS
jgi:hypothetical protein